MQARYRKTGQRKQRRDKSKEQDKEKSQILPFSEENRVMEFECEMAVSTGSNVRVWC